MICCWMESSSSRVRSLSRATWSNVHVTTGSGSASTLQVRDTWRPSVTLRNMLAGDTCGGHAKEESGTWVMTCPCSRGGDWHASCDSEGSAVCSSHSLQQRDKYETKYQRQYC